MASDTPGAARVGSAAAAGAVTSGAARRGARVVRFSATERALHWVNAVAMLAMIATGLTLYLPFLARLFSDRPLVKGLHLFVAALWLTALLLVVLLGDRGILRRTRAQFERIDRDDLAWLRHQAAPQGRFNGGQKLHAVVQAALLPLFFVSGVLLWLGERNTAFRLAGTIALHDVAMFVAIVFIAGHLYKAFARPTRPALSGMLDGTVPARWAAEHHQRWNPAAEPLEQRPPLTAARLLATALVAVAGLVGAFFLSGW